MNGRSLHLGGPGLGDAKGSNPLDATGQQTQIPGEEIESMGELVKELRRRVSVNRNGTPEPLVIVDRRSTPATWGRDPGGSPLIEARCEQCGLAHEVIGLDPARPDEADVVCADCDGPVYAVAEEELAEDPTECPACLELGDVCRWHAGWASGWDACAGFMAAYVNGQSGEAVA